MSSTIPWTHRCSACEALVECVVPVRADGTFIAPDLPEGWCQLGVLTHDGDLRDIFTVCPRHQVTYTVSYTSTDVKGD